MEAKKESLTSLLNIPRPTQQASGGSGDRQEVLERDALRQKVIEALKQIYDPEIPVNIYELGLIYNLEVDDLGVVNIKMTLTAPGCPVAGSLVQEIAAKVGELAGVSRAQVDLVWDPPWRRDRMSEAAKLELGML